MYINDIVLVTAGEHDLQIGRIIAEADYSRFTVKFADGSTEDIAFCDMKKLFK